MGVINLMKGLFYGGNHMYYIGVDLGTSSLKLLLMDEKGKIQNIVSKEYNLYFPKEGWAEQNPQDWWRAFETGILELFQKIMVQRKWKASVLVVRCMDL